MYFEAAEVDSVIPTTNPNITEVDNGSMATARGIQINQNANEVPVQFTVHDENLVNHLAEYDDSEQADVIRTMTNG
mgnify:CR=1 FL=1